MLAHLRRPGGAVQADEVDAERLQRGQRGPDLGAEQHGAGGLHGDVHDQRQVDPGGGHRPLGAEHGRLGLQQVLAGLHQDRVDPAVDHGRDLGGVRVPQLRVRQVAQGGQLGARTDAAEHPARPVGGAVGVGRLPGDPRGGLGELADPVGDVVLVQGREVRAEGVGLDAVDADLEVGVVDGPHHVGPGHVEDLVAALELVEVVQRQVVGLQHRAHRPVADDDTSGQLAAQVGHPWRIVRETAVGPDSRSVAASTVFDMNEVRQEQAGERRTAWAARPAGGGDLQRVERCGQRGQCCRGAPRGGVPGGAGLRARSRRLLRLPGQPSRGGAQRRRASARSPGRPRGSRPRSWPAAGT